MLTGIMNMWIQPGRIALFEDNSLNQEIEKTLLEECGMQVTVAENGEAGLQLFSESKEKDYDAILMDIRMPVMDGYAATRAIRNLPREDAKTIPIVAMSADAFAEDVQKCKDAGMNAHVAKPIDVKKMMQTLLDVLKDKSTNPKPDLKLQ